MAVLNFLYVKNNQKHTLLAYIIYDTGIGSLSAGVKWPERSADHLSSAGVQYG